MSGAWAHAKCLFHQTIPEPPSDSGLHQHQEVCHLCSVTLLQLLENMALPAAMGLAPKQLNISTFICGHFTSVLLSALLGNLHFLIY